jgi:polysaccharide chain length determinant protein (PEP-CTERM system associated)
MLGHREMTVQDYAEILKRRFWLLLTLPILFLAGGMGVSRLVTPQYMSQTLVIIEHQTVPEDYVKSVVAEDLDARLASMKEQILSRSRLQPIIERYNLFSGNQGTMDDRVEMMQKAIGVKPIPSASGGMPGFFITFQAQDPRTAQQVCSEITSLFTAENQRVREQSAEGTNDFLRERLADSKAKLDEQDARLAAFEQKYLGRLPDQEGSNANTLQALTTQLDTANQTVSHAQQNVTFLEAMVSQQSRDQQHPDAVAGGLSIDERRTQLRTLIAQKQELETLYTADHPDVVAISRKIADLQADIAHAPTQPTSPAPAVAAASFPDSPQLLQLKAQLRASQQALAAAKQEQSAIEQKVRSYEAKIEASPVIEEEYKQVTRDHETALQFYNSLLSKMNESSMATALERRQEGEQFRLMDAANLPEEPTSPNRIKYAGGGLGIGLALGLLIAGLLEYRDTSVRNERDISAFTKLPTLAIISHIENLPQRAPEHSGWKLFSRGNKTVESVSG